MQRRRMIRELIDKAAAELARDPDVVAVAAHYTGGQVDASALKHVLEQIPTERLCGYYDEHVLGRDWTDADPHIEIGADLHPRITPAGRAALMTRTKPPEWPEGVRRAAEGKLGLPEGSLDYDAELHQRHKAEVQNALLDLRLGLDDAIADYEAGNGGRAFRTLAEAVRLLSILLQGAL